MSEKQVNFEPCPCCGGEAQVQFEVCGQWARVYCKTCGLSTLSLACLNTFDPTPAVEKWNKRVGNDQSA